MKNQITVFEYLIIIGTVVTSGVALTTYAFTKFVTVEQNEKTEQKIEKRLERIENKIDYLLEKRQ